MIDRKWFHYQLMHRLYQFYHLSVSFWTNETGCKWTDTISQYWIFWTLLKFTLGKFLRANSLRQYIYIFLFAGTFFCGSQEKSQEIEPAKNFVPQSSPKTQKKSSKEKKSGQHIRVSNVFPPSCLEILDIIHFNKPVGTFLFDPGSLFLTNTRMIWRSRWSSCSTSHSV